MKRKSVISRLLAIAGILAVLLGLQFAPPSARASGINTEGDRAELSRNNDTGLTMNSDMLYFTFNSYHVWQFVDFELTGANGTSTKAFCMDLEKSAPQSEGYTCLGSLDNLPAYGQVNGKAFAYSAQTLSLLKGVLCAYVSYPYGGETFRNAWTRYYTWYLTDVNDPSLVTLANIESDMEQIYSKMNTSYAPPAAQMAQELSAAFGEPYTETTPDLLHDYVVRLGMDFWDYALTHQNYAGAYVWIPDDGGNQAFMVTTEIEPLNPRGFLRLHKSSADPAFAQEYPLEDALYGIYADSDCQTLVKEVWIQADGYSSLVGLDPDDYYIREIQRPAHYRLDTNIYPVTVTTAYTVEQPLEIEFEDEPELAHFHVIKTIARNAALTALCPDAYSLDGTEFTIYRSADDRQIAVLTIHDGVSDTIVLPLGDYYAVETHVPDGFAVPQPNHFPFSLTVDEEDYALTVENDPLFDPMTLLLQKENTEGRPLAGAQFTVAYYPVQASSMEDLAGLSPLRSWVLETDDAGCLDLDESHFVSGDAFFRDEDGLIVGLPGSYLFTESLPPAHFLACEPFLITLEGSDLNGSTQAFNAPLISDAPQHFYLEIQKCHPGGSLSPEGYASFEGAVFVLYTLDGDVRSWESTLVTDAQGRARIELPNPAALDSAPVRYYLKETQPSPGCVRNPATFVLDVGPGDDLSETVTQTVLVPQEPTQLLVRKDGEQPDGTTVENLPGAVLVLERLEGGSWVLIERWTSDDAPRRFTGLPVGNYRVREESAPTGYKNEGVTVEYTLTETPFDQWIVVTNTRQRGSVSVQKQSEDGVVEGLCFCLEGTAQTGETLRYEGATNAAGVWEISNIPVGSYSLYETGIPDRYENLCRTESFDLAEDEQRVFVWNNVLKPEFSKGVAKADAASPDFAKWTDCAGGGRVIFRLRSTLHTIADESSCYCLLEWTDTLPPGLVYAGELSLRLKQEGVPDEVWNSDSPNLFVTVNGAEIQVSVTAAGLDEINTRFAQAVLELCFQARLDADAVFGDDGNVNRAAFLSQRADGDPLTLEDEATVYSYALSLTKEFEGPGDFGKVTFHLMDADSGQYLIADSATGDVFVRGRGGPEEATLFHPGSDGRLILRGLAAGRYRLEETQTAPGYELLPAPVSLELILSDSGSGPQLRYLADGMELSVGSSSATLSYGCLWVINYRSPELPLTGRPGRLSLSVVCSSALLLCGACTLLYGAAAKPRQKKFTTE